MFPPSSPLPHTGTGADEKVPLWVILMVLLMMPSSLGPRLLEARNFLRVPQRHHYRAFCTLTLSFILPTGVVGCTAEPLTVRPLGVLKQLVSSNVQLFRLSGCMRTNNNGSVRSQLAHFPPVRMCHLPLHTDLLLIKSVTAWDFSHSPLSVIQSK